MAWLAVGVVGAMRPPRQNSRPREAGAGDTTGAALGGWSRRPEIEEALWPLGGHRMVTGARIV